MNTENEKINKLMESIKERVAKKNKHKKEHMIQEQGNLLFDDETPDVTVKKSRNTRLRGSKPKPQNLDNHQQTNLTSGETVLEGIQIERKKIQDSISQSANDHENKNETERKEQLEQRKFDIKKRVNRLSESIQRTNKNRVRKP